LLLVVDGRFDSIEWSPTISKGPIFGDNFFAWKTQDTTESAHFAVQHYGGFAGITFRLVAIDPLGDLNNPTTTVIQLAKSTNQNEMTLLLALMKDLELSSEFDYDDVWKLLSKEGGM